MARPTKLDLVTHEKIVTAIRAGNYIETAAAYAGINKTTLYDWLKRGAREQERVRKNPRTRIRKKEVPYVKFSNAVEKALAEAEIRDVTIIGKAAEEQWQAAAWRLERKFPTRWGKQVAVEHSGKDGGPIAVKQTMDLSQLSVEELKLLEGILEKTEGDTDTEAS